MSHAPGYSFPSGHAANTAAICMVLVVLLWPLLRTRAQRVVAVVVGTAADPDLRDWVGMVHPRSWAPRRFVGCHNNTLPSSAADASKKPRAW